MDINNLNITITPIIALIIGLVLAFAGYRLKKIAMAIIWFVIGYSIMAKFAPNLIEDPFWQLILQIGVGAVLSMVGLSIEKLAVSLTTGVVVFWFILEHFGPATDFTLPAIAIACGVVAGTIAVWMMKPAVIVFTAVQGANLIATNLLTLIPNDIITKIPADQNTIFLIVFAIIAVVGIGFQWTNTKSIE